MANQADLHLTPEQKDTLKRLYTDSPAAFSSKQRLMQLIRQRNLEISEKVLEEFLNATPSYTLFRRKRASKADATRVYAMGPNQVVMADLAWFGPKGDKRATMVLVDAFTKQVIFRAFNSSA